MRETGLRYARNLTSAANPPDWRALAHGLLATHSLAVGRWQEADAELAAGELLSPEHGVPYRALMALNSPLTVPESTFRHLRDRLLHWDADSAIQHSGSIQVDARSWLDGAQPLAREYLLALIEIRLGQRDSAAARAVRLGTMPAPARVGSLATDLAATVRAAAAWRSGDAAATLRELETQQFVIPDYRFVWPFFGQAEARMLRASALARLGRDQEALGWLVGLQHPEGWSLHGVLIAPAWRLEGEIHEGAGRREEALRAYRRFLELWKDAGPEAQEQIRDVRVRVAALAGESG
jgi:tetratricopeptide (TPR) repeat protein